MHFERSTNTCTCNCIQLHRQNRRKVDVILEVLWKNVPLRNLIALRDIAVKMENAVQPKVKKKFGFGFFFYLFLFFFWFCFVLFIFFFGGGVFLWVFFINIRFSKVMSNRIMIKLLQREVTEIKINYHVKERTSTLVSK